ncbi:MAG: UDP-glucose--hexose-1-phosphate uridylyltransferase [Clostridia bacterium]|nr:UDP-glucose--hexose-1-phosphate uridylyltransferase [Clostridia bacterium]
MINAGLEIERLLQFGEKHGLIGRWDAIIARNQLLDLFQLKEPYNGNVPEEDLEIPFEILNNLVDYAAEAGLFDKEVYAYRELFDTRVMGMLMPRESEIIRTFYDLAEKESVQKATDYFYNLSIVSNYIRMAQIRKNILWNAETEYGDLEITINLSKPEKDPKAIALERLQPQSNYPKCLLCMENIGYAGRINFPARQTLRIIPITLCGEQWYLQYSPYVYYNEHCIVFSEHHVPMVISRKSFEWLLDFVRQFPHYICGSNADLPIVGGSILSHNHFQGGNYTFPMHKAGIISGYKHSGFKNISIGTLKWPLSVIRAASDSIEELIEFSDYILNQWRGYSDAEAEILAHTENGNEKIPHNTITPIARMNPEGKYEMDLVLRNNRTSEEHPDGIFHPHREIHHIKKENIGLIEVMGLAILPGRLQNEIREIKEILCGKMRIDSINQKEHELYKHLDWIKELAETYGLSLAEEHADEIIQKEIGKKFKTCLEHTGVFKQNEPGQKAFDRFLVSMGCKKDA